MTKFTVLISLIITNTVYSQLNFPGNNVIGKSYNVFGEYANSKSIIKYNVFNFDSIKQLKSEFGYSIPNLIYLENISDHIITTHEGSSINTLSKSLSESAGLGIDALYFKISIDEQFNKSVSYNSKLFYFNLVDINTKWRISIDTRDIEKLKQFLDIQFKTDIENLDPKIFFERYGSHIITNAYLGGRIDYFSTTKMNKSISEDDVKSVIKAKYEFINSGIELSEKNKKINQTIESDIKLKIVGGNSEFSNSINNQTQYKKWAEGISSSPVICGFDKNSLLPIWELASNPKRKAILKSYFDKEILTKNPLPIYYEKDEILDNEKIISTILVQVLGFEIIKDCDYPGLLTTEEDGDFQYSIEITSNNQTIYKKITPSNQIYRVGSGEYLETDIVEEFKVDLTSKNEEFKIKYYLTEYDDLVNDDLGKGDYKFYYPFYSSDFYNETGSDAIPKIFSVPLINSQECKANFQFKIAQKGDQTAFDLGNKGWEEFKLGHLDESLNYYKKALSIDISTWFVQFNVALVYLIQKNPNTYEKYKLLSELCLEKNIIRMAYNDILEYEKQHGKIEGSEEVKILLRSKL